MGYKHFNARGIEPLFPFGHGLSYTTFEYADLKITSRPKSGANAEEWKVEVNVTVKNSGTVAGSHSVHFYTCPPTATPTGLTHPSHTLQAYTKAHNLAPGKSEVVEVTLDKCTSSRPSRGGGKGVKADGEVQMRYRTGTRDGRLFARSRENGPSRSGWMRRPCTARRRF